jgi:hypothetical protein
MTYLNRFTTIPILFDMIRRKRLVLMDPALWEDKNDSELLFEYKRRKRAHKLYAMCFSGAGETIHHWKAFAGGCDGCCFEIDREKLVAVLETLDGVRYGDIEYKKIRDVDSSAIDVETIPFTKRWPYECEKEFRIIWTGRTKQPCYEIPIALDLIKKITLSQKIPNHVATSIREYLRDTFRDTHVHINHSTLYANRKWINKFKER